MVGEERIFPVLSALILTDEEEEQVAWAAAREQRRRRRFAAGEWRRRAARQQQCAGGGEQAPHVAGPWAARDGVGAYAALPLTRDVTVRGSV